MLSLLPFSVAERIGQGLQTETVSALLSSLKRRPLKERTRPQRLPDLMLRGSYPEIATHRRVDRSVWCGSYITTYLERDIRSLAQVGDLSQFERFLQLAATRTGQILNLSEMARELGITVPTAKRWLSMLETGFQVLLLYPYYRNIGKRLIKSPKLYFNDTALASYLLGIHDEHTLMHSPHFGNLFETLVVTDFWKRALHSGERPALYYLRTHDGFEVDLAIEVAGKLHLIEVKSSATVLPTHASSLLRAVRDLRDRVESASIIARAPQNVPIARGITAYRWQDVLGR